MGSVFAEQISQLGDGKPMSECYVELEQGWDLEVIACQSHQGRWC